MTISTTIEQSKHLLELGLDQKTADMWWSNRFVYWQPTPMIGISTEQHQLYTFKWCDEDVPAWSLSALLEVIPKEELIDLSVSKDNYWFCSGVHFDTPIYSNPIDAAYAQVKWLLEQGLIKKGEQDDQ
jgi:hypothetical protein